MELKKELKYWHAIRPHMTSETLFKNLHQPEGFKSWGYKLWITEWLFFGGGGGGGVVVKKPLTWIQSTCTFDYPQ